MYKKINVWIQNLKIEDEKIRNLIIKNFKATEDNSVFVNFYKTEEKNESFGKEELFKKIADLFKNSEAYKDSENLKLDNKIEILKKANSI